MDIQLEGRFQKNLKKGKFQHIRPPFDKRLAELTSAANLEEFVRTYPAARCHERSGAQAGIFSVDLTGNYRLCFRPLEPFSYKEDAGLDIMTIVSIIIIEIDDPHK